MKIENILEKADELEWRCIVCDEGLEFEKYSPAGEDFIFYVTGPDFVRDIKEYAANFDADEHAEMWIESRGTRGVPSSIRELIDDADAIQEMLNELSHALEELEELEEQ